MPSSKSELRIPPPLGIDDPGLTWTLEGTSLTIVRKPTARAILFPVAGIILLLIIAFETLSQGSWLTVAVSTFFVFVLVISVIVRLRIRVEMNVGSDGMEWEGLGAHRNYGKWPAESISAVRVARGRKPTRWGSHAMVNTEIRVHQDWVSIVSGHDYERSVKLANELSTALGVPKQTLEYRDRE